MKPPRDRTTLTTRPAQTTESSDGQHQLNSEELDAQGLPQLDTADVSPAERLAFERLLGDLSALFAEVTRLKERLMAENHYLRQSAAARSGQLPTSRSPVFNQVLEEIAAVAPTCSTVLLRGETGSGKEVLADAIHALSGRRERPLIKVN